MVAFANWLEFTLRAGPILTSIVAGSIAFGALIWQRNEARRRAMTDILRHFLKVIYHLNRCCGYRRKLDTLLRTYGGDPKAAVAHERIKQLHEQQGDHLKESAEAHGAFEAECGANVFRFDESTRKLFKRAHDFVSGYGQLVMEGKYDAADVHFAKGTEIHSHLTQVARELRVSRQVARFLREEKKPTKPEPAVANKYQVSNERMNQIFELVHKRATTEADGHFKILPPRILLENPDYAMSDDVTKLLDGTSFAVVFQGGSADMLKFHEMMVFTYQLIQFQAIHSGLDRGFPPETGLSAATKITVDTTMDISEVMKSATVKVLLAKLEFAKQPSESVKIK